MNAIRLAIPISILLLIALLGVMGRNLWTELRHLSTAGSDNAQWTILQLDTELANLYATFLEQAARPEPDPAAIRLRTDIALSRIDLLSRGNAARILAENSEALDLAARLERFGREADAIVAGEITRASVMRLMEMTAAIRPEARQLAMLGITIGADRTEASRNAFAAELRRTGIVAIAVIAGLTASLIALSRILQIARQRDRALRASSARLASTVSASLDAILTANGKGEIVDFNAAAEEVLGWRKDEVLGHRIDEYVFRRTGSAPGLSGPPQDDALSYALDRGRVELAARRRTGEEFPAEVSVTSVSDGGSGLIIAYLRDISERKRNERALIDAKERAERTDRAKSQFLTVISHEMRTPLNGILGVLDLLRTTSLDARQMRYVEVATSSGEVLLKHVNEALDITRIETGSMALSPQRFSLAAEVERVAAVLDPLAREKGLDLKLDIDPGMRVDFLADGARISQIVTNLVGNAIKFTSEGSVTVSLRGIHSPGSTQARVAVSDTGPGIPEDDIEAIFEDFVALTPGAGRQSRGDGLGLSISRKIARLMDGDIKASSTVGAGSRFTLTLPLERAARGARDIVRPGVSEGHDPPVAVARRVLVVEDNAINRSVLCEMLSGMGHEVHEAADGREGFNLALLLPFDLILMDIGMPEMDGIEATLRLRQTDGPNRTTPIHGLTAHGEDEFRRRAEAAGMDGFSTKPIRIGGLKGILDGVPITDEVAHSDTLDIDANLILELLETLGTQAIRKRTDQFFREADTTMAELAGLDFQTDTDAIRSHLHRFRGAAALFGLRALSRALDQALTEARKGDRQGYASAVDRLGTLLADARRQMSEQISGYAIDS